MSACVSVCACGSVLVSLREGVGVYGAIGACVGACMTVSLLEWTQCLPVSLVCVCVPLCICVCVRVSGCGDSSPILDSPRVSYGPSLGGRHMVWVVGIREEAWAAVCGVWGECVCAR